MLSKDSYSISVTQGNKIAHEHDERVYTPHNADRSLASRNVSVKSTKDLKAAFNDFFRDSIAQYNEKQKREDRKKSYDYYSDILNGSCHEKPLYEYVIQIGNHEDNGVTDSEFDAEKWRELKKQGKFKSASTYVQQHLNRNQSREELKEVLLNVANRLESEYPSLKFWSIQLHDDESEGTAHSHIIFSPIGEGYKNGMQKRCSLSRALEQMGFVTEGNNFAVTQWQNDVKSKIVQEMNAMGYARQYMNNTDKHLSLNQFKLKTENEKLAKKRSELESDNAILAFDNKLSAKKKKELEEQEKKIKIAQREHARKQREFEAEEKALRERERRVQQLEVELNRRSETLLRAEAELQNKQERMRKRERVLRVEEYVDRNVDVPSTQRHDRALPQIEF